MKQVLFLANKLHGYEEEIIDEFKRQKYNVFFINTTYKLHQIIIFKLLTFLHLTKTLTSYKNKIFKNKLDRYKVPIDIDILFCIANNFIEPSLLGSLSRYYNIQRSTMYLWDNQEKLYYVPEYLKYFNKVCTFDLQDSKHLGIPYRPTFYSNLLKKDLVNKYELFFTGNYSPKRKNELDKLLNIVDKSKCFIYLYENFWMALVKKYIKRIPNYKLKDIKFKSINRLTYNKLISQSKIIVEISNSTQRGVTQRALDALFLEKKLITNISHIINYDFYDNNNILLFDDIRDTNDVEHFSKLKYKKVDENIIYYYSREKWLVDLMNSTM